MRSISVALSATIVALAAVAAFATAPRCQGQQLATSDGSWTQYRCANLSCPSPCNPATDPNNANLVSCNCDGDGGDCNATYDWSQPGVGKMICPNQGCPAGQTCWPTSWVDSGETHNGEKLYKRWCECVTL